MKVYCKYCKFIFDEEFWSPILTDWCCEASKTEYDTHMGVEIKYGVPYHINKNNDCKLYRPAWWYALWLWILRRKPCQ
jgi:hypothetical protein